MRPDRGRNVGGMTDDPGDMVAIGTAGDPMEGAMIREFLTSNGIDCMIQGENHRSMLQIIGAYIELRILVPKSQAEAAAALLAWWPSLCPVSASVTLRSARGCAA